MSARLAHSRAAAARANVHGCSRNPIRGCWCTPKWLAELVGPFDLDPFSNPRSHVVATHDCMLERGDDGLVRTAPGTYYRHGHGTCRADFATTVWFQPDYSMVLPAFRHYAHTRWVALLRFDPSTKWFAEIYAASALVCVPRGRRVNFEPPPGVPASSNAYPHALFYRHEVDVTDAVLEACIAWRKKPA